MKISKRFVDRARPALLIACALVLVACDRTATIDFPNQQPGRVLYVLSQESAARYCEVSRRWGDSLAEHFLAKADSIAIDGDSAAYVDRWLNEEARGRDSLAWIEQYPSPRTGRFAVDSIVFGSSPVVEYRRPRGRAYAATQSGSAFILLAEDHTIVHRGAVVKPCSPSSTK